MSDFTFMRAGVGPSNLVLRRDIEAQMASLVCSLLEKSLQTAAEYCKAGMRTVITEHDLVYALRYEASVFLDSDDMDERIRQFYSALRSNETHDEGEEDEEESEVEEESHDFCEASDDDPKAAAVNRVNRAWASYAPADPIKQVLKASIDNTVESLHLEFRG